MQGSQYMTSAQLMAKIRINDHVDKVFVIIILKTGRS